MGVSLRAPEPDSKGLCPLAHGFGAAGAPRSQARLGISKSRERSGAVGQSARAGGKGARISGLTKERSGVTGLEISKGAH